MAVADKRVVSMSLAMPFYPIERPWTSGRLLPAAQVDRESYVAALSREALGAAPDFADCRMPAVAVGGVRGGIAGHMADDRLGILLRDLRKSFDLTRQDGTPAEVSMAVHPGMVSASTLDACRLGHVTRLCVDYATSNAAEARELGRFMGPEAMEVTKTVLGPACRLDLAFSLLVGIPGQTQASAVQSVEDVLALGAAHVSLAAFELDPASRLADERAAHDDAWRAQPVHRLPGAEERAAILAAMGDALRREGLSEYLPGLWARPGHESLWEQMRAQGCETLGFGLAARTLFDGIEALNTSDLATYLRFSDDPQRCIAQTRVQTQAQTRPICG